jgi:hypothetical protein
MRFVTFTGGEFLVTAEYSGTIDLGDGPRTAQGGSDALLLRAGPGGTLSAIATVRDDGDSASYQLARTGNGGLVHVGQRDAQLSARCTSWDSGGKGFIQRL